MLMSSADSALLFRGADVKLANEHIIIRKDDLQRFIKKHSSVDEAGSRMIHMNIDAFM